MEGGGNCIVCVHSVGVSAPSSCLNPDSPFVSRKKRGEEGEIYKWIIPPFPSHMSVCPAIVCVSRYFYLFLLRFPKKTFFRVFSYFFRHSSFSFTGDDGMLFDRTENLSSKKRKEEEEEEEEEMSQISLSHKLIF